MSITSDLIDKIKGKNFRIVFPEATEERNLHAIAQLNQEGLIKTILDRKSTRLNSSHRH